MPSLVHYLVFFVLLSSGFNGAHSSINPSRPSKQVLLKSHHESRKSPTKPVVKKAVQPSETAKKPAKGVKHDEPHHTELMSAPTAVANVLADLCPHGMLPIGE